MCIDHHVRLTFVSLVILFIPTTPAAVVSAMDLDSSLTNEMTLFAIFDGDTKTGLQNPPELVEVGSPSHHGVIWTWTAEMIDGFDYRTPTISFTHEDDGTGETNEYHIRANLVFDMDDWSPNENGSTAEGTFRLKLSNGTPAQDRTYWMSVTMRSVSSGLTVIAQQTSSEPCVSAAGANGFSFSEDQFDWGGSTPPSSELLTLNSEGRIIAFDFGDALWTEDGTFRLNITDGTRPTSHMSGIGISLRSLVGDGYTVVEGQTQGENGISAPGYHGFTFSEDQFDWGGSTPPSSESLALNSEGRIAAFDFGEALWTEDGTFRLKLQDGERPASYVTGRGISLRALVGDGYTVISGQTQGEDGVSSPGYHGFTFSEDQFDWGGSTPPSSESLTLNSEGRIIAYDFGSADWTEDGTFRIKLQDGDRPASYVTGRGISLRALVGDGYTVIDGQTQGGEGVSAPGYHGLIFSEDQFDWGGSTPPSSESLTLNAEGRITAYDFGNADWTEDGTFRIRLRDGDRPASYVTGHGISLRALIGDGYTVFDGQTQGGDGVSAPGYHGFTFTEDQFVWGGTPPSSESLTLNSEGRIVAYEFGNAEWTEDGTFRIRLQDGDRPFSYVTGRLISLRHLSPQPLVIPGDGGAGNIVLEVASDSGPWNWSDYADGLATSVLTAPDTPSSTTLTISWLTGAVLNGESGNGSVIVQRNDGSAPASTATIPTEVGSGSCCGLYTSGITGNANCGDDGKLTLSDISRLIDNVYISKAPLCCHATGNTNASVDCKITLSDITRLIDAVYISKTPPAACMAECEQ